MPADPQVVAVDGYFTAREAAEFLSCSVWLIRDMIKKGELTSYRIGNSRAIRVRKDDVKNLLAAQNGAPDQHAHQTQEA